MFCLRLGASGKQESSIVLLQMDTLHFSGFGLVLVSVSCWVINVTAILREWHILYPLIFIPYF